MSPPLRLLALYEVRRVMDEKGMTQRDVARAIGVSDAQISLMFRRAKRGPNGITMGTLERLGEALDVTFTVRAEERA